MVASPSRTALHGGMPVPVTLELINLLPLEATPLNSARYEHTIGLTHYCRLELIVNQNKVLYDQRSQTRTTHPRWQHLNEFLPIEELTIDDYETLVARLSIDVAPFPANDRITLFQIPIHPSKLSRIKSLPDNPLPLNFLVVTFSDNSIRVSPAVYTILLERHILKDAVQFDQLNDLHRFQDDAFGALDYVTATTSSTNKSPESDRDASPLPKSLEQSPQNVFDSDTAGETTATGNGHSQQVALKPVQNGEPIVVDDGHHQLQEQRLLKQLIEEESIALEQELATVIRDMEELKGFEQSLNTKREDTVKILQDSARLRTESEKTAFLTSVQRIRLFRELWIIYPITFTASEERYRIRGLEIPHNILGNSAMDDEVYAALGYLCHMLIMIGKYLSVQYRYRMYYQASRSAILDDRAVVYPLFLGRSIERDQFEQGFRLLSYNIDFLVRSQYVRVSHKLHVLGKVRRICENVIDGY